MLNLKPKTKVSFLLLFSAGVAGLAMNIDRFSDDPQITKQELKMIEELQQRSDQHLSSLNETVTSVNGVLRALPKPPKGEVVQQVEIQQFNINGNDISVVLLDPHLKLPINELQSYQKDGSLYRLYYNDDNYYLSQKNF